MADQDPPRDASVIQALQALQEMKRKLKGMLDELGDLEQQMLDNCDDLCD